jgi:hypothetical protein
MLRSIAMCLVLFVATTSMARALTRDETREALRDTATSAGALSDVGATFRQSAKNPYNFIASIDDRLTYSDSLEVVISVTKSNTIGFRIYPHYKGDYINIRKASDPTGLMTKLLWFSDQNFLFWGADDEGDVFTGYTITLESGYPKEAVTIVLRSIRNTDKFVGQLQPYLK